MLLRLTAVLLGVVLMNGTSNAVRMPAPGDWVNYKVMRASEWMPTAADEVRLTVGARARLDDVDLIWWQMVVRGADMPDLTIQALSERVPMTAEDGDIGLVFRYVFAQDGRQPLEYVNQHTGLAHLPIFGFRDGLIPTPRSVVNRVGPFLGTGNYLGQALAAHESGTDEEWRDLGQTTRVELDDDVLIGTARLAKDDGTGQDETGEYKYVELSAKDLDVMIDAGFNIFMVNNKYEKFVRDRGVFFVTSQMDKKDYPALLYRSNYWGPAMFTDEPAIRLDTSDCRTVYDAANLLRLRDYTYHRTPGNPATDFRLTQSDGVIQMIHKLGYNTGDWSPMQYHVPVWETIYESAFYQLQGGAAGLVHEGRYNLDAFNGMLAGILGPGAQVDVDGMYDLTYCFMRGAARCFGKEWGTAIYGQADYSIAPEAIKKAYDMGAHYIWFWTSDHDHHLPFPKQLELSRILRAHQKEHPRSTRLPQLRAAKVAVAIPDGYICSSGLVLWGNASFRFDKLNEFGVPYGRINAEAYWQMYRLLQQGIDFDCVVDVPEVIDNAGYEQIIRIGADGRTSLAAPKMPARPVAVSVEKKGSFAQDKPAAGAPKTTARYVKPGSVKIDGKLDDWSGARWIDLDQQLMYDVTQESWQGEQDLSAKVAFAYDEDAVYIAARVRDDVEHGTERGDLIWQNDSLQVAFDPLFNAHPEGCYAADDVEIGFALVDGKPYAHKWTPGPVDAPGELAGAEVAITREGDVTCYEVRAPFAALAPLTPAFPGRCGVSAAVNDSDTTLRKGAVAWTKGLADGKNPSLFGVLEFEGSEKLKSARPMAFAQAEKVVVKRGEDAVLRLDTGARTPEDMTLTLTVRSAGLSSLPSATRFAVPAGMNRFDVRLDTSGLESGSYDAALSLQSGDAPAVGQNLRIYVLP